MGSKDTADDRIPPPDQIDPTIAYQPSKSDQWKATMRSRDKKQSRVGSHSLNTMDDGRTPIEHYLG